MSTGRLVNPDLGMVMCPSFLTVLPVSSTSSPSPAIGSIHRDVDSLVFTHFGNHHHEECNCHRKENIENKLANSASIGDSAANQWGVGFQLIVLFFLFCFSDASIIRECGCVSVYTM